jgi:2-polyprenyl-6-methoxyphenol hydroxylase-like FAD-dependent oxidoreductase
MHTKHAIVVGASMGGLLAARALSRHFDKVTVFERDAMSDTAAPRKGVPQGRHAHGLLARGRELFDEFFPGLSTELVRAGALYGDIVNDVIWYVENNPLRQAPSSLQGLLVSRPMLETYVRRRLTQIQNVSVIAPCDVVGFVPDAANERIVGVEVRRDGNTETIAAHLVVDASGRGSQTPVRLSELGYAAPQEERVDIGLSYLTRVYRRRPDDCGGRRAVIVAGAAPNWRNGALLAQENDQWICSIAGFLGDDAPRDEAAYLDFVRSLPDEHIFKAVSQAEPLTDFVSYKFAASLRRRYDRMKRFPQGLLAFGDALCSFNPVYGQGMTVAALEAQALDQCLAAGDADLARRFFERARQIIDVPWSIAVGGDLRHPRVEGRRDPMLRFINWYIAKLSLAARRDSDLSLAFLEVANLMKPPPSLLAPRLALKVWRGCRKRPVAARVASPSHRPSSEVAGR